MVTKKQKTKNNKNSATLGGDIAAYRNWWPVFIFWAVAVLLFYPPFYRGMFFKEDLFIYHIFTALVFILLWVDKLRRKDYTFIRTPLDWAVLAYAGAYLISLIGAVHIGEAIYGFLKALNLFMIYWMITQVVRDFKDYKRILQVILAAALGVTVIGLLARAGYSIYPSAMQGKEIASTLQYSNTLAIYLAVVSLLGITLWVRARNLIEKNIYGIISFLLILVILCSQSKGTWIAFAIGLSLLIIGFPGWNRIKALLYTLITLAIGLFISGKINVLAVGESASTVKLVFLGVILITLVQLFSDAVIYLSNRIKSGKTIMVVVLIIILAAGMALANSRGIISELKNIAVIQEIGNLGNNNSYSSRMDFNRWAMAIVKDYPITGAGAGGWNALYHSYQDYQAYTTEVHNHFMQVWVEAGTIGILTFILLWLLVIIFTVGIFRKGRADNSLDSDQWILSWGTLAAALTLGLHAAMDFDLSLAAMSILLWSFFALLNSAYCIMEIKYKHLPDKPAVNVVLAAIMAGILLLCGSNFAIAYQSSKSATADMGIMAKSGDVKLQNELLSKVEQGYIKAVSLDSYNGNYHANLAQVYAIRYMQYVQQDQALSQSYYRKAVEETNRAASLSYYDIKTRSALLNTGFKLNNIDLCVEQAEAILNITPNDGNAYNAFAKVLWIAIESNMKADRQAEAVRLAKKLVPIEDKMEAQKQRINPERSAYWQGARLVLSPESHLNIARADYLLGDYNAAKLKMISLGLPAITADLNSRIWYAAILYKTGDITGAEQLMSGVKQSNPELDKQYEQLIKQK